MNPFAEMVRAARRRGGITQDELAAGLGVSQPFVAHVEKGLKLPAEESLGDWARLLHVRPEVAQEAYQHAKDEQAGPNTVLVKFSPEDFARVQAHCREIDKRPADFLRKITLDVIDGLRPLKQRDTR